MKLKFNIKSMIMSLAVLGLLLSGFSAVTSTNSVTVEAQYGSFQRCERFTDPVKKEECNARTQAAVDRRIDRITARAGRQIKRAISRNLNNLNAAILSILNNAFWEVWNVINVIFPLA